MLLKKAGMVVVAAGAGMVALTPAAFAGDWSAPSDSSNGGDHGGDHGGHWGHDHWGHDHGASARNGGCANFGDQLIGVNCTNVQAPINDLGVLSTYDHADGGAHAENGGPGGPGAAATNGGSVNFGRQLVGVNGTNIQAPINNLGVLSSYLNG